MPSEKQADNSMLEAVDFDPDFDRGSTIGLNCRQMLDGLVHSSIIERLVSYQNRCFGARQYGLNPRTQVPTNFLFKGAPDTGKTATAQHMGEFFYNSAQNTQKASRGYREGPRHR